MSTVLLLVGFSLVFQELVTGSLAPENTRGWRTYRNAKYGYEIRHPDRFEVRETGPEGAREGATIRMGLKEHAAIAPALEVYVGDAATKFNTVLATPQLEVETKPVEIAGMAGTQTTYRWRENGDIAFLFVRVPNVLFSLDLGASAPDPRRTIWWQIISTFRFV